MSEQDEKARRPAFQFYPADWRKDVELQSCSMAAQGLWINAMCLAHQCRPYGHLTVNGRAMTPEQLGRQVGLAAREAASLVRELEDSGVLRRTVDGVMYSKRMVDDEMLREARAAGGHAGAEHGQKGASHGKKGGRPKGSKGAEKTPLADGKKPPPSSSSSSSSSDGSVPGGTDAPAPPPVEPPAPVPPAPSPPVVVIRTLDEDERRELWSSGKALLVEGGMAPKMAGGYVSRLITRWTEPVVIEALRATLRANPKAEVKAYLEATCQRFAGARSSTTAYQRERHARIAEVAPEIAAGASAPSFTIDAEVHDVTAKQLG